MRLLVACLCLVPFAHARPSQEERPSIAAELDALIEKTNGLKRFRAVYELTIEGETDKKATLELKYVAPDNAELHVSGDLDVWSVVLGNRYYVSEDGRWRTFEVADPAAMRVLEENFPSESALGPGLGFELYPGDGIKFSASYMLARPGLLLWLTSVRRGLDRIQESQDQLVWTSGAARLALSRKTGFPEEIRAEKEGRLRTMKLVGLELDGEAPSDVAPPEEARSATADEAMAATARTSALATLRHSGFLRVEERLRAGTNAWGSETRGRWDAFLDALHRDMLAYTCIVWARGLRDITDRIRAEFQKGLDEQDTPEARAQLRAAVPALEAKMVGKLDQTKQQYLGDIPAFGSDPIRPRDELYAVEREVVERLYAELVSKPALDYLREQIGAVLDDKH